jgi:hypothetical protein
MLLGRIVREQIHQKSSATIATALRSILRFAAYAADGMSVGYWVFLSLP